MNNGFRFEVVNLEGMDSLFPVTLNCDDEEGPMKIGVLSDISDPWEFNYFIEKLRNNSTKDVDIEINSRGGSVDLAMGLFNALAEHAGKVTARITGIAASSGLLVAQGADEIRINENAQIMMHPGMAVGVMRFRGGGTEGMTAAEFAQEMVDKGTEQIIDLLSIRSGQERGTVEGMVQAKDGNGTTLTATEAVEMGFADELIAMVPRGERQGLEPSTQNAAWNMLREKELALAKKRKLAMQSS